MYKAIHVARNDLRITFQDGSIWINLLIIPVILIVVLGAVNGAFVDDESDPVLIDVHDRDQSELSAQLLTELRAINDNLLLCPMDGGSTESDDDPCKLTDTDALDFDTSVTRIEEADIDAIVEISEGFGESVLSGERTLVTFQSADPFNQPSALSESVSAAVGRIGGASVAARIGTQVYEDDFEFADDADREAFVSEVYDSAAAFWAAPPAGVDYATSASGEDEEVSGFNQSVPGMGSMYVMFTVMGGALLLLQERQNWTFQRLTTTPITRAQLLGGKMMARFAMGMIQYAVAFGVGFALGVDFGDSPAALLLLMVSFVACMTALTFLFGTFVTSEQQAGTVSTFIALTLAPLGGAWWPLEIVPDFMQTVGHISPIAWVMDGFNELSFRNGGLADVSVSVAVLLGMAAVMFGLAITRFKYD